MIIKLFKGQQPLVFIVLPVFLLIIWLFSGFHYFTVVTENRMPFYSLLSSAIKDWPSWLIAILGFIITGSQGIHLNLVLIKHEVLNRPTYLPVLFYFLFASFLPQFVIFHPILLVNSILIIVLDRIFKLYKNTAPLGIDFDICFLIGIASLVYLPALLFSFLFFIGLTILKPFSWRDWIVGAMGLLLPFFFVFVYYFLTDKLSDYLDIIKSSPLPESIAIRNLLPKGYQVAMYAVSIVFILSLVYLRNNFYKNDIKTRNYHQVIVVFIVISVLCALLTRENMLYKLGLVFIPLTVIVSNFFLSIKKNWWAESLFIFLLLTMVFNYFISY